MMSKSDGQYLEDKINVFFSFLFHVDDGFAECVHIQSEIEN